ncbi:ZPR1-related zinc finger protein [mine drainage metagenome]|uniref:ZPR1-related zinc finger protein n=1 Tax=mine drainage metagenome TaxID=410659 RepID=T1C8G3_9ZZZZ
MVMSEMDDYEAPEEIETSILCPVCESKIYLISYSTEIPVEGRISIQTYLCRKCFYKKSNIYYDERENPRKLIFRVESPGDLGAMIYRSPSASLKIPEIDAEIIREKFHPAN